MVPLSSLENVSSSMTFLQGGNDGLISNGTLRNPDMPQISNPQNGQSGSRALKYKWACPFYRRFPEKYKACKDRKFLMIHRVK
jgi:hypothetical protein